MRVGSVREGSLRLRDKVKQLKNNKAIAWRYMQGLGAIMGMGSELAELGCDEVPLG